MLQNGDGLGIGPVVDDVSQEKYVGVFHGLGSEEIVPFRGAGVSTDRGFSRTACRTLKFNHLLLNMFDEVFSPVLRTWLTKSTQAENDARLWLHRQYVRDPG
jgi:hypothetical protein